MEYNPQRAAAQFLPGRTISALEPFGDGHINGTYLVTLDDGSRYVLQRINHNVFRKPFEVMANAVGVTSYLRAKFEREQTGRRRETLRFMQCAENSAYCWLDPDGSYWRMYHYVGQVVSHSIVTSAAELKKSGEAFGEFMSDLADYPAATLYETIPRFHDTVDRYRNLEKAIAEAPADRLEAARADIEFYLSRKDFASLLVDELRAGNLPLRVTHNDTKLNNVLLDCETGEPVCVIDLDTVMPGLAAYDFGDSIRFGCNPAAEDEPDLSKVNFSLELYRAYTEGYLSKAGSALTERELWSLPVGSKMMTLECGSRFLADYLSGDTYFRISRPGQNLDRARTQAKLVADMEQVWDELTIR